MLDDLWKVGTSITIIVLIIFASNASDDLKHIENKLTTSTTTTTTVPVTTTTYLGIKCMVNGYEINTNLSNAEAAGCK